MAAATAATVVQAPHRRPADRVTEQPSPRGVRRTAPTPYGAANGQVALSFPHAAVALPVA